MKYGMPFTNIETSRREGGTVSTHRYVDCPSSIINVLSIKNLNILMVLVSENFLIESELFLQNKNCPLLRQGICIYVGHSFLRNTIGPILPFCALVLSGK